MTPGAGHPGAAVAVGEPLERLQGPEGVVGVAARDQPGRQLRAVADRVRLGGGAAGADQQQRGHQCRDRQRGARRPVGGGGLGAGCGGRATGPSVQRESFRRSVGLPI